MADLKTHFLAQLDGVLAQYARINSYLADDEHHDPGKNQDVTRFQVSALAAIDRIAGAESQYATYAHRLGGTWTSIPTSLAGIVQALRDDVAADYVLSAKELIHADVFSDFLEGAEYLLGEGYKDPAAVMGGGVLEGHLRQLCTKHGVPIMDPTGPRDAQRAERAEEIACQVV